MGRKINRKKQVRGFIFPAPVAGLIVLLCMLALGYIRLGIRCEALGRELKQLESAHEHLSRRALTEEFQWRRMHSTARIEEALRARNIVMGWPQKGQIVRMGEALAEAEARRSLWARVNMDE